MTAVKIMVVDDTITYRQIVSKVVESIPGTELVASASSGRTALMKLEGTKPDLIFLDVMMPEMDGIETLRQVKLINPDVAVVMVSGVDKENAKITLASLEAGALDFVAKPQTSGMAESMELLKNALEPIINLVRDRLAPHRKAVPAPSKVLPTVKKSDQKPFDLVVLGISTGGPNALYTLFSGLKGTVPCPFLIVQHMPPLFTQSLAERLDWVTQMKVKEAQEGDLLAPGMVFIAPGGKHMVVTQGPKGNQVSILDSPPVNHCKPAVDVLFASVSKLPGLRPLSVVMTGMGRDGTEGVKALKGTGTYCLVQDEATSVVWGMPGSVYESQGADEVLPLEKIGARILELTCT